MKSGTRLSSESLSPSSSQISETKPLSKADHSDAVSNNDPDKKKEQTQGLSNAQRILSVGNLIGKEIDEDCNNENVDHKIEANRESNRTFECSKIIHPVSLLGQLHTANNVHQMQNNFPAVSVPSPELGNSLDLIHNSETKYQSKLSNISSVPPPAHVLSFLPPEHPWLLLRRDIDRLKQAPFQDNRDDILRNVVRDSLDNSKYDRFVMSHNQPSRSQSNSPTIEVECSPQSDEDEIPPNESEIIIRSKLHKSISTDRCASSPTRNIASRELNSQNYRLYNSKSTSANSLHKHQKDKETTQMGIADADSIKEMQRTPSPENLILFPRFYFHPKNTTQAKRDTINYSTTENTSVKVVAEPEMRGIPEIGK